MKSKDVQFLESGACYVKPNPQTKARPRRQKLWSFQHLTPSYPDQNSETVSSLQTRSRLLQNHENPITLQHNKTCEQTYSARKKIAVPRILCSSKKGGRQDGLCSELWILPPSSQGESSVSSLHHTCQILARFHVSQRSGVQRQTVPQMINL